MAEKTIVDKAGETVGIGMAMAADVAGAIKNGIWRGRDHGYRGSEEGTCEEGSEENRDEKGISEKGREKSRDKEDRQKAICEEGG